MNLRIALRGGGLATLCLAVALGLAPAPALAQSARADVAAQLKVVTDARAEAGFLPDTQALGRSSVLGVLEDGGSVYLEMTLDAARE